MKRQWTNEELITHWTISTKEIDLIGDSKTDHNLLGAACLLKYFQYEGRFPDEKQDIPPIVIVHLAQQLGVVPEKIIPYDWEGRTIKAHRAAIRAFLGVHEATLADEEALVEWLCQEVVAEQRQEEALIVSFYTHCKEQLIDPPTPDRVRRLVHTAIHRFDERLCASITQRLSLETRTRLDALLTVEFLETQAREEMMSPLEEAFGETETAEASQEGEPPRPQSALHALKQDTGPLSLSRVLHEIAKLECIHQLGLPADLFAHVSAKTLDSYRNRIAVEDLQEVRRHPDPIRFTLLAGYCWRRRQEIVDILVQLLLDMAHHLTTKAERRVEKAFVKDIKKVSGKTTLLFRLAEAAVDKPDGTIREVVFPVVSEQTLRDLVKEYKAGGSTYQQQVQKAMRGPYSKHYRRMLQLILKHLAFCSNNEVHQPIIQALDLLRKYIDVPLTQPHFASTETVPLDEIVPASWRKAVVPQDNAGKSKQVSRLNYELCVLHTLREKVRSKEVWVRHASRFRNPDDDLPTDFARKRTTYYEALHLPLDADTYIQRLQADMTTALEQLDQTMPDNPYVRLLPKGGGWISLTPLPHQPQPQHLRLLKAELGTRWSMVELLDILKETDLRVRFTDRIKSPTVREHLDRATIQKRLLLALYGLGTNIGLKRVCAGDHGESYRDVLYACHRFLTKDALRAAIADVANAIFRVRLSDIWGEGTTACASDSKKILSLGPEPDDGRACPLSWPWGPHLLACRTQGCLHLFTAQALLLLGSGGDDHRPAAPRLGDAGGAQLRRYPWPERAGICVLFAAGLSVVASSEKSPRAKTLSP